jgi:hypothetical protein
MEIVMPNVTATVQVFRKPTVNHAKTWEQDGTRGLRVHLDQVTIHFFDETIEDAVEMARNILKAAGKGPTI